MATESMESPADDQAGLGEAVRAYQAAIDDYDRELARILRINETDLRCLEILLQELPEAGPSELAERLGLTTGSTTALLDRLEKAGYLTRSPHPTDRRKSVVRATPDFQQRAYALVMPLVDEGHQMVAGSFTPAQVEVIAEFMRRATALQRRHTQLLRETPS
jgi:DNA-binding MarR family transcriptional regulator